MNEPQKVNLEKLLAYTALAPSTTFDLDELIITYPDILPTTDAETVVIYSTRLGVTEHPSPFPHIILKD